MLAPPQTTWVALGQVCHNINKRDTRVWKYPQVIKALKAVWISKENQWSKTGQKGDDKGVMKCKVAARMNNV